MNENLLNQLLNEIKLIIEKYRNEAIERNFEIGKVIVSNQHFFSNKEKLLENLGQRLPSGFNKTDIFSICKFYETYKENIPLLELAKQIGLNHNKVLLDKRIDNELRKDLLLFAIENKISAEKLKSELIKRQGQKKLANEGFKISIESIEIKNFKSIVDLKIEKPNPFSVFVGTNACGKSNIFTAIDLLFYSYYNSPQKGFNDYGGKQILNFYRQNQNVEISLRTDIKERLAFVNDIQNNSISRVEIREPFNEKLVNQFCYLFIKEGFKENPKISILEKDGSNFKTVLKEKILSDIPTKDAFIRKLRNAVADISEVNIEKSMIDGADELYIKDKNYPEVKIPETLISEGTKRIIILLTAILQSKEPQFICIEEPENGIHPFVLEPFIDTIRNICESEGHYVWLTTHSPTLVRHLKRQELIIVDKREGQTQIKKASDKTFDDYFSEENLSLDDAWLANFFDGGLPW